MLIHHFSTVAFEDSISPICEIILLLNITNRNIASIPYGRSCLKPTSGREYVPMDVIVEIDQSLPRISIALDKEHGQFVNVFCAKTDLKTTLAQLKTKSKDVISTSRFSRSYPHSSISVHDIVRKINSVRR